MKAFIPKTTTAISIPDRFASLEGIDESGAYRYRVHYLADPRECSKLKAFLVKIHISKTPYVKKINPIFGVLKPYTVIDKLRSAFAEQKDATRAGASEYLMTFLSDMTSRISNSAASSLKNTKGKTMVRSKQIVARPVENLNAQNVNAPVLDANLGVRTSQNSEQDTKSLALSMLFNSGIDPAEHSNSKTNTIRTAQAALDGVFSKVNVGDSQPRVGSFQNSFAATLLNHTDRASSIQLDRNDFLGVVEEVQETFIEVIEDISIPQAACEDGDFYIIYELVNNKGFSLQVSSNLVPHNQNLRYLRIPTKQPKVAAMPVNRPGKVAFEVSQNDPNAKGISVYKKSINPNQNVLNGQYTHVGKMDLVFGQPTQRFEDVDASINQLSYRFIPYYDDSSVGSVFSSAVVKFARESMAKKQNKLQRQNFVSITGDVKTYGISVSIKDLPYNAISVTLKKRNLSIKQSAFETVGQGPVKLDLKGNGAILVDDSSVAPGRVYEYTVFIMFKDGCEVAGSNTLTIEYQPIAANIANIQISEPRLVTVGNGFDAVFNIELNSLNTSMELVKKLISEQGLQAEFQRDISENKEKLNKLFAFSVARDNLATGEHEEFGIIDSMTFSDRKYGVSKNVKPLDPGAEYRYTITAYFRNPETLFPTLTRTVATGNTSYDLQPSKWLHPITINNGTLVTESSLLRNHAKSDFALGTVADIQTVNLSLANVLPEVEDAQVSRIRDRANLIQWKINGAATKIDHFIIALEILGMRTIVGAAHSITNSNYFEFVDTLDNGEKGALTYIIVPVYYDYSKGTETKTNTVIL